MEKTHKLIKLKAGTVQNLKRLMTEMGIGSLDDLINTMIRVTNEHRFVLKGTGWDIYSKR
jgi:hypothetical protein